MRFPSTGSLVVLALGCLLQSAHADEGMWTFNNFPADKVKQSYGFAPDQKWLQHVQLSSIRLARGCSASLVVRRTASVMTNHHCAHSCIEQLSTGQRDYVETGFYAKEAKDEGQMPRHGGKPAGPDHGRDAAESKKAIDGKDGKAFLGCAEGGRG